VAGTATANLSAFGLATLVLAVYLCSPWSPLRLSVRGFRFRRELFWEILRVGAPGSLNTILTNLTVVLMTGLVGPFGTAALAGYGMGARLEYIQIPLVFGMGSALVAMVGTNVGAGQIARAERIAWTGAGLAAGGTASIGLVAAVVPGAWLGLFTTEPQVHAVGATYLLIVGPAYGFFGLGLALYFASQGAGRLAWPLTAGFARLAIAAAGGWLGGYGFGWGLPGIFAAMALALIVFGTTTAAAVKLGAWR
jgi:Na+-driven multidrug efflux pump